MMRIAGFPTVQESEARLHKQAAASTVQQYKANYTRGMRQILQAEDEGNYQKAARLQKKYQITNAQKKAAKKSYNMTIEEVIRKKLPERLEQEYDFSGYE
jgi:hypothetical protein